MKKVLIEMVPALADGGGETLVKEYAKYIDKDKFELHIVAIYDRFNSANKRQLEEMKCPVDFAFKKESLFLKVALHFFRKEIIAFKLKKIVKRIKPDIIHVHMSMLKYVKLFSGNIKGVKLFYTCHSLPSVYFSGENREEYEAAKFLIQNNHLQLIALHKKMANELNNLFGIDNTITIPNGIDISKFRNVTISKESAKERIGIPQHSFVVGHIGRFAAMKNHDFLIDVFKYICSKKPDSFLLLVGNGDLRNEIENKIEKENLSSHVIILEHQTDTPLLYKAMDVFIFPSAYEGFGIVVIEAQTAGIKCIVSDTIPGELCATNNIIFLPLSSGVQFWGETAMNLKADNDINDRRIEKFDIKKIIKQVEEIYNSSETIRTSTV